MSGRGAYYKQKYGISGGRGRRSKDIAGNNSNNAGKSQEYYHKPSNSNMKTVSDLGNILRQIDGKQYPCYKDIYGTWNFDNEFKLFVDHVQGDAYASPSRMRVQVYHETSKIPETFYSSKIRTVATRDYFTRTFSDVIAKAGGDMRQNSGGGWHGAKGGDMTVDTPGQSILERTSVILNSEYIEARFTLALPAQGRRIMGNLAYTSLIEMLPKYVSSGLLFESIDESSLRRHVECAEDSDHLRKLLPSMGLVSFVANGSILPRLSGASDKPMTGADVIRFSSPKSLEMEVQLPNRGTVKGMGIKKGVTLISGGGFHGKSTLLKALERGVYNHVPGDGRELVITDGTAVKIRAEDGRNVACVDISTFIGDLPYDKSTNQFTSPDASGSTSQAANIQEALEVGSKVLLLDEDTCATNFMIRDARMQLLVRADKEPIKPLIAHIRSLSNSGVSTVMVIGGCGEFFDVADHVLMMDSFTTIDVTAKAKEISSQFQSTSVVASMRTNAEYPSVHDRQLVRALSSKEVDSKIFIRNKSLIAYGDLEVDLSAVEQIVDVSQSRAIAQAIVIIQNNYSAKTITNKLLTIKEILDQLEQQFEAKGLDALSPDRLHGNFAMPRRFEIAATINRIRSASFKLA